MLTKIDHAQKSQIPLLQWPAHALRGVVELLCWTKLERRKNTYAPPRFSKTPLPGRLMTHLSEFLGWRHMVGALQLNPDQLEETFRLANEARGLAFEMSLIPGFESDPILQRASFTLRRYWASAWSNGGVDESSYRLAIKSVLLALQRRLEAASASANVGPAINSAADVNNTQSN